MPERLEPESLIERSVEDQSGELNNSPTVSPRFQAELPRSRATYGAIGLRSSWRAAISLLAFAAAWQGFSIVASNLVAPGWEVIVGRLLDLDYTHVLSTWLRLLVALTLSFLLGLVGAVVLSRSAVLEAYAAPLIRGLMAVPAICWVLFSVLWFGNVEHRIAFVLSIASIPIFLTELLDAIKSVPRSLREIVASFRPSTSQYYCKLVLPAVLPSILTSWKINTSLGIRVVTIAEVVGAVSGIGYALNIAQQTFVVAEVFAWTVVLVVMLLAMQAVIGSLETRLLRWRE